MPQSFEGIKEKLKRSHENVLNLQIEVNRFFEESKYPSLPQDNMKLLAEAMEYHRQRAIPLRFSVLVGEIAHHLRSCLDHIVWQFSSESYRREHLKRIEFPILETRPIDKDSAKRHEGKIKGITNSGVLDLIEKLQPYNSPNPIESALLAIHNIDITDKHRELVLCFATGAVEVPPEVAARIVAKYAPRYQKGTLGTAFESEVHQEFQNNAKIVPTISFSNFRGREFEAVMPAIMELNNEIVRIVSRFDNFLPR